MTRHEPILLLQLAGVLQSWGLRSQFNHRDTAPEPTKSGIVGLLAAALGRERDEPIEDLTALRLAVRTDQPGTLLRDYHTVADYRGNSLPSAEVTKRGLQKSAKKETHETWRYYLQDAVFLAALQGPAPLLDRLDRALRAPRFPLALGRRSCLPSRPLALGIHDGASLDDALQQTPWLAAHHAVAAYRKKAATPENVALAATIEDPQGDEITSDVPLSFDPPHRRMTTRQVRRRTLTIPTGLPPRPPSEAGNKRPPHDPFALLGW